MRRARDAVRRVKEVLARPPNVKEDPAEANSEEEQPENVDANKEPQDSEVETGPEAVRKRTEEKIAANKKAALSRAKAAVKKHREPSCEIQTISRDFTGASSSGITGFKVQENPAKANATDLDHLSKVSLTYSGFNPPPPTRRAIGDLFYLNVATPHDGNLSITATPGGFHLNKIQSNKKFDPTPADDPALHHSLLELILDCCPKLKATWETVLLALRKKPKSKSSAKAVSSYESPLANLYSELAAGRGDANLATPSWTVPRPTSAHQPSHSFDPARAQEDFMSGFGMDDRGAIRDWNEELQVARELPSATIDERLIRAKMINKVMFEFGDAAVQGALAISQGHVMPINVNEPVRHQVYVFNNIFFSVAGDSLDTFKATKGDAASRKGVNKDCNVMGILQKLDTEGALRTFATTVIDYVGMRIVAQSIAPGILSFDQQSSNNRFLCHGAVDCSTELITSDELTELLEITIGEPFNLATRKVPANPSAIGSEAKVADAVAIVGPVEAKGIIGTDSRRYLLDVPRVTVRDANWLPLKDGGTGLLENTESATTGSPNRKDYVPKSLDDDEWTACVLRPEVLHMELEFKIKEVKLATKTKMQEEIGALLKKFPKYAEDEKELAEVNEGKKKILDKLKEDEQEAIKRIRDSHKYNANVFFPLIKGVCDDDEEGKKTYAEDEEKARDAAKVLFNKVLPAITDSVRRGTLSVPVDGDALTEMLHQNGINCRYLGYLATLAKEQLPSNLSDPFFSGRQRFAMPLSWVSLLELEMVARASKHILDSYMATSPLQPAPLVAAVLNALVCVGPESVRETDARESNAGISYLKRDYVADGTPTPPSFTEVWERLRSEIGRRFRYNLSTMPSERGLAVQLLRRVCKRSGIRIVAKSTFPFEGEFAKCKCGENYPLSASSIGDILPVVKHSASYSSGFNPVYTAVVNPSQVGLNYEVICKDAMLKLEEAQVLASNDKLGPAYAAAEHALQLIQEVVGIVHKNVISCFDVLAYVLNRAGELENAVDMAHKALLISCQLYGIDSYKVLEQHQRMSQFLLQIGNSDFSIMHAEICTNIIKMCGGLAHPEVAQYNYRVGLLFTEVEQPATALKFLKASIAGSHTDLLKKAEIHRDMARVSAEVGDFVLAKEHEKFALSVSQVLFGKDNAKTKKSEETYKEYFRQSIQQSITMKEEEKMAAEKAAAELVAGELVNAENAAGALGGGKKSSKKKKKSKGKK